jgi:site-specific recombinase XerD
VGLLERYYTWLISGGASEYHTNTVYLPIAGHVLGLNLLPHEKLDLGLDLMRALEYVRAKGVGEHWLQACHNGLNKFRRFLYLERGLNVARKEVHYDIAAHTRGLPAWLVRELKCFQRIRGRNWKHTRARQSAYRFWHAHLCVWHYLCRGRGIRRFGDMKRQHVLDYIDQRLNAGYAVASVNNELRAFHAFLRFLEEQGYGVPRSLLRIPGLKLPDTLPKFLTDEQVRKLQEDFEGRVSQARLSNHRRDALLDRAAFYLLWQGGLRIGEVEEIRLEDLDLPNRKLAIRNSKGAEDRMVFLTDRVVLALKEYLAVRGMGHSDHVFLYRNAPLKKDLIRNRLKAAGKRVGVDEYPHRLRHTCATQLLNTGCRITSIQRFLGHKSLSTTMIYAHAHDKTVAKHYFTAMEKVEQEPETIPKPKETASTKSRKTELLGLIERLEQPELTIEERLEIAKNLKQVLSLGVPVQHPPPVVCV